MSVNDRVNRASHAADRETLSSPAMAQTVGAARSGGSGGYQVKAFTISTHITFGDDEADPVIDPVDTYKGIMGIVEEYDAGTNYTSGMKCWVDNDDHAFQKDFYNCIAPTTGDEPPNVTYWEVATEVDLHIMGTQVNGDDTDHKKYIPWFPEATVIPVMFVNDLYFISWAMVYTDNKSVSWIEKVGECAGRAGAVFR